MQPGVPIAVTDSGSLPGLMAKEIGTLADLEKFRITYLDPPNYLPLYRLYHKYLLLRTIGLY